MDNEVKHIVYRRLLVKEYDYLRLIVESPFSFDVLIIIRFWSHTFWTKLNKQ